MDRLKHFLKCFQSKAKQGFTLIEITAVVLILGILAAIALPQYKRVLESSRVSEAVTMLGNIETAEKMYWMQMGQFTSDFSELMLDIPLAQPEGTYNTTFDHGKGTFFEYDLSNCIGGECIISASRGVGDENHIYEIRLTGLTGSGADGVRSCHATDDFGVSVCLIICGADAMSADGSCMLD